MTEELIERVARALFKLANGDTLDPDETWNGAAWWQTFIDDAKATITAMQPHIAAEREDAARRALYSAALAPTAVRAVIGADKRQKEALDYVFKAIRAIDPAQFRRPADGARGQVHVEPAKRMEIDGGE